MLVLIAESKTMTACDRPVAASGHDGHRPAGEAVADAVMASIRETDTPQLASATRLSATMVRRLREMAYEFPNKALGSPAIEAYTGVVFKAFAYPTLDAVCRADACRRIRIISSLYGWLRPDDIIKAYRLDFTTPLAPGGKSLAAFQRKAVTDELLATLKETGEDLILNLLPGDAAKLIDWRQAAQYAAVVKADFVEVLPGGATRTPNSNRLKTLRGKLLRQIITDGLDSREALLSAAGDDYAATLELSDSDTIIFTTTATQ